MIKNYPPMRSLWAILMLLCASFPVWAATETFSGIKSGSGSYGSGSFTGDDGSKWSYTEGRTDQTIDGNALTIRGGGTITSGKIAGGCASLAFDWKYSFSESGSWDIDIYINDVKVAKFNSAVGDKNTRTKYQTPEFTPVAGDFTIKLVNNATSNKRITIDNITWESASTDPAISFDPAELTELNFSAFAGDLSDTKTVKLKIENIDASATVTPNLVGTSDYFTANNNDVNDVFIVEPVTGSATDYEVTFFAPATEGTYTATLSFSASVSGSEVATSPTIVLTGTATGPTMSVSPAELAFSADAEATSQAQVVTLDLVHVDASTVTYALAGVGADYFAVAKTTGTGYSVVFNAPDVPGTYTATLTFSTSVAGVAPASVALTGTAVAPTITLWSEDFSGTSMYPYPYTLKDGGSTTKTYDNDNYAGGMPPELLISKNGGSMSVDITGLKGASGDFALTFKSNHSEEITITSATEGVTIAGSGTAYTVSVPVGTTALNLKFINNTKDNARVDNFLLIAPDVVTTVATFPGDSVENVVMLQTNRMSITFNKPIASYNEALMHVRYTPASASPVEAAKPRHLAAAETQTLDVKVLDTADNTLTFQVKTWDTCLPEYAQLYTVDFEKGAVTFDDGKHSPAVAWNFMTEDVGTGIDGVEAAKALLYDGHSVIASAGGIISLYNLAGARIAEGRGSLSLDNMAHGVYVARCGSTALKVVKR